MVISKYRQPRFKKRPSQRRSQALVNRILDTAADILEEQGLRACTTNNIARRAATSVGSLYQYFPNRDSIMVALIDRETQTLLNALGNEPRPGDWKARLEALVRIHVEHRLKRPRLNRIIDFEERRLRAIDRPDDGPVVPYVQAIASDLPRLGRHSSDITIDLLAIVRGMTTMPEASVANFADIGPRARASPPRRGFQTCRGCGACRFSRRACANRAIYTRFELADHGITSNGL